MPRETELKYSLSPETWELLLQVDRIGDYVLEEAEYREIHDVYADTQDRAINSAGFAFRIRSRGDVRIACLKGTGRGSGLGHSREEYECQIDGLDSPSQWPAGETRDRFLDITKGEPVRTEVEIRQTRIKRLVKSASQTIAELSLDEVRFESGSGETTVFELEVELLEAGSHEALEHLHDELVAAYELHPVETSKFERAIAFRDALRV